MTSHTEDASRLLSLQEFNRMKFDHIIPVYELGIDRSQITYWRRQGLLLFIEKGKWATVSLVEAIWLMMLEDLRKIGVGTATMKKLNEYFIRRGYTDDVPRKNLMFHKDRLEKKASELSDGEKQLLAVIEGTLNNEVLLYAYKWDVNYFSNLITESVVSKCEAEILIFFDGQIVERVFNSYQSGDKSAVDFSKPHIKIPLRGYLETFIESEELEQFLAATRIFTPDEEMVLREMKNKNIKELSIQLHDGKVQKIKSSQSGIITGSKAKEIRKVLGLKNYESITLDTRDHKTLSFSLTKKNK